MSNATAVKLCPHCKTEVDSKASRCPHCHGKIYRWTLVRKIMAGGLGALLLFIIISVATGGSSSSSSSPNSAPASVSPQEAAQQAADLAAWQKTPAGQLCTKHQDWTRDDCDKLLARKVWVGMSYDMLVYLRGAPDHKNVSNYGAGNQYQYCWDDRTPSCFYDDNADGILDSYN